MTVSQLTADPFTNMPILILKDEAGTSALPIWIGVAEAAAIATELEQIALDRPMTHDLLASALAALGATVERIEITCVRDHTYYAAIHLRHPLRRGGRRAHTLDARPSDAIALALRTGAPIRVARAVIERSQSVSLAPPPPPPETISSTLPGTLIDPSAAQLLELLESLSDEEFGKWKM